MKNIVIANFPRFNNQIWLPVLWASAKTYYERNGERVNEWHWEPSLLDIYSEEYFDDICDRLRKLKPTIFAISLYVWNYKISHRVAEWVKTTFPDCLVISGGPHQYFKHDMDWFKDKWYIDASLPGDSYGEICFKEILDNYDNGKVDWEQVTDLHYPIGKQRRVQRSRKTMTKKEKRVYDYDYTVYASQAEYIEQFVEFQRSKTPHAILLALLETTRGCPYGCTYCDWGGGTSTAVIKRGLDKVKADIDCLKQYYLDFLYIGDANFGIFEERDIDIIRHLTDRPWWSKQRFKVGYGGFAKTANRMDAVREIVRLDVEAGLSQQKEIKLSMQTLDDEVLENIDRKNIPLDIQLGALEPIARDNKLPMYVEIIMGLPGMTLDKFYTDFNILGDRRLSLQFFEWILLPETPAYARDYRERYGILSIEKTNGWTDYELHGHANIVVGAKSFTTDDYLQMLLSASMYRMLIQGGYYRNTIEEILGQGVRVGELIRTVIEEFYYVQLRGHADQVRKDWQHILDNREIPCQTIVANERVYIGWYFVALAFHNPEEFTAPLINFLQHKYNIKLNTIEQDQKFTINCTNFNKKYLKFPYVYDYTKDDNSRHDFDYFLSLFQHFSESGKIFSGNKKLLGVI
jgi:putative methyltransferase